MFKFNGTLSELRAYLAGTFTQKTAKTMELGVFALNRTVQTRGNYAVVCQMLRFSFTARFLKSLQLEVEIYQPNMRTDASGGRVLDSQNIPADVTLEDVFLTVRKGTKIAAIKAYRSMTGVGLVEAKDFVEKYQRDNGLV